MKPFYFSTTKNFGDHMNSWLWAELIPDLLAKEDDVRLIGIGSLLARDLDLVIGRKLVFGTGSGYSNPPTAQQAAGWDIRCVRGPLTARLMGLAPEIAVTDGAWLINLIPRYATVPGEKSGTVFIPHWSSAAYGTWDKICPHADITYVDPLWSCDRVFNAIANAELVLAESLHAAIIADYYRTHWIPVASPGRILTFKWLDWCASLGIEYNPFMLPPSDYIDCLAQGVRPGRVKADLRELSVDRSRYDIRRAERAPRRHGIAFETEKAIKKVGREGRTVLLGALSQLRNSRPFADWNRKHSLHMTNYLTALSNARPNLSTESMRSEKIDRLNHVFLKMHKDYS